MSSLILIWIGSVVLIIGEICEGPGKGAVKSDVMIQVVKER